MKISSRLMVNIAPHEIDVKTVISNNLTLENNYEKIIHHPMLEIVQSVKNTHKIGC
jgi:hypothetical protein